MSAPGEDPQYNALTALGLVTSVGLVLAVCIVAGVLVGRYLDRILDGGGLILVGGILAGIAAGLFGAYQLLSRDLPWNS